MRMASMFTVVAALLASSGAMAANLGISRNGPDGAPRTLSEGVKVYGGIDYAESCSYDPNRDLIVVPDRAAQIREGGFNDGWISFFNHDGSVNTLKWVQADGKKLEESKAWINEPLADQPLDKPFGWALIKLDGADTAMLHAVDAGSIDNMSTGMRVKAKWRDEREGHINDIECFVPEGA